MTSNTTDRSQQIADLKAQYPGHRVVAFRGDPIIIVLRRPTEQEVLTIGDKAHLAGIVNPSDNAYNYDNGAAEILGLAVSPDKAIVERLAEQRPRLARTLWGEVQRLCTVGLEQVNDAPEGRVAFLLTGNIRLELALLKRSQYEIIDFRRLKSEHRTILPSWLAGAAKQSLVSHHGEEAAQIWEQHPFLSGILGMVLYGELSLEVEEEEGK